MCVLAIIDTLHRPNLYISFLGFETIQYKVLHWFRVSDDPYYCGLRARIPNFAKSKAQKEKEAKYGRIGDRRDKDGHPMVWHGPQRGYLENGESK